MLGNVDAQNVVLASQTDGGGNIQAICIRIEVGASPQTANTDWVNFVTGFASTLSAVGPDWSITLDQQLIVDYAVAQFQSGLNGMQGYTVDDPATGSWSSPGAFGAGQIDMGDDGHFQVSECPNNIGVTISSTVDLELSGGNLIEHGYVDWDLSDGDVFVCGLAYGGPIGVVIGAAIAGPLGAVVGGIIGGALGAIVVAIIATVMSGNKSLQGNFNSPGCTVVDQHHFTCTTSLDLPSMDFGAGVHATLSAGTMVGLAASLSIGGTAAVTQVGAPEFDMTQPDPACGIGIVGQCFQFASGYQFSVQLTGSEGPPLGAPTTVCSASNSATDAILVLDDPGNLYAYSLDPDNSFWLPINVTFTLSPSQSDPYFSNPYAPILYVRTSSGSYSVRLPKLEPASAAALKKLEMEILNADIGCNMMASGWLGQAGKFDPHWLIDPGPEGDMNIWEIVAAVSAVGEIGVSTAQGVQLGAATLSGRYAQLSVSVSGAEAQIGGAVPVQFSRNAAAGAAPADATEARAVDAWVKKTANAVVSQRVLRARSQWTSYGGVLRRVTLASYGSQPCAILAGEGAVEIVSLATPARPTLRRIVAGARGAMALGAGLLTWNEHGLFYDGRRLLAGDVTQVVARSGHLYALAGREIAIFDARLKRAGSVAAPDVHALAAAGQRLAAATPSGLQVFDLTEPAAPKAAAGLPLEGIRSLEKPAISGSANRVLAEVARGSWEVIDLSGDTPNVAAHYVSRPWFAGAATLDGITVVPAAGGNVAIFSSGQKATQRF